MVSQSLYFIAISIILVLLLFLLPLPSTKQHYYEATTQAALAQIPVKFLKVIRNDSESVKFLNVTANSSEPVLFRDLYTSGHDNPHPELCPYLGMNLRLMILITSDPSHFKERIAIRMTWRHYAARADVSTGFFLGYPPSNLKSDIEAEDKLYKDIIFGRFVDSYSNLTLKTVSMLEWVDTYCYLVPKMLKTDDDVFVNVPNLLRFSDARLNATRTIWGVESKTRKVERKHKHFVPRTQYPGDVFPKFVVGPAYLITSDCIKDILVAAPNKTYLRLEDVFVTGVLRKELGIKRQIIEEFGHYKGYVFKPCVAKRKIAIHSVTYHEQFHYWRTLHTGKMKCLS
ncbi:beta-1,3-galactosyltransferase 5-like [Plodia interpunctella]|uniref:beta-1,3-galactosyltransferase 5-like n=1 Tax=Plodia interpunctella TaxID=58824 RepID=UPI0023688C2D|nr:beta-1,3-galactosyltransferase 5-like [Plodia interpunctella]